MDSNNDLTKLYGEFLVRFEFICSRIRFLMLNILYPNFSEEQKSLIEIMTEGLTADLLRRKILGLIIEKYSREDDIYKITKTISSIFTYFIELRNSFAHGTAFIGKFDLINETEDETLTIRHPKIKKMA